MATAPLTLPEAELPTEGTLILTPVHRMGEQVLNAVTEIGGLAQFSGLTFSWLIKRRPDGRS